MRIVSISSPTVGHITWELPEDLATKFFSLPEESQGMIRTWLEQETVGHASLLIGALKSGEKVEDALELINAGRQNTARQLLALIDHA